jgi:RNA polymerase sigma-70 factor (ECF subfamily)
MLVERHATDVYRLAAAIVGETDARDLTQDTFAGAWIYLRRLRDPAAFGPWLRRICVNRCRNWLRSRARRGPSTSLDAHPVLGAMLTDPGPDFRRAIEARAMLEPTFEHLSPDQRAVLALHYSMGLSIAESAEALGIRIGTAKSRLHAGLETLRRAIIPGDPDPGPADAPTELLP